MMSNSAINNKIQLRRHFAALRDALRPEERQEKSERIRARLFESPWYHEASSLFTFMSFRSEVETGPVIADALQQGKRVMLPRIDREKREMQAVEISGPASLTKNAMGIWEPARELPPFEGSIDLLLAPGLAFDLRGYRLGYGGGYYDRFLATRQVKKSVGLAFEIQIGPELPHEPFDMRLDQLISEKRILSFTGKEKKNTEYGP